ncbi:hypothetical protein NM688_g6265 [Phlebia brevispora]|uniref:Uncharacterized protein n=1 Tax=Phlebia brevispora TaxID=194682 RepID=A0ACC1SHW7_9APHY|nr:hypothetical protein NM688_g6265 [Phlebia brevispora]
MAQAPSSGASPRAPIIAIPFKFAPSLYRPDNPHSIHEGPTNCAVRHPYPLPIIALAEDRDRLEPGTGSLSNYEAQAYDGLHTALIPGNLPPAIISAVLRDPPSGLQDATPATTPDAPKSTAGVSFVCPSLGPSDFLSPIPEVHVCRNPNSPTPIPSYDRVSDPGSFAVRLAHGAEIEQVRSMTGAFYEPQELVEFCRNGVPGVPLKDFLDPCGGGMTANLDNADDTTVFEDFRPKGQYPWSKARYMLFWPGYQLQTRQQYVYYPKTGLITRRAVVIQVAEFIRDFFAAHEDMELAARSEHRKWSIGAQGIKLENLELVKLLRISKASVMPVLRYSTAV